MRKKGRDGDESIQVGRVQRDDLAVQCYLHSKATAAARSTGHTPKVLSIRRQRAQMDLDKSLLLTEQAA